MNFFKNLKLEENESEAVLLVSVSDQYKFLLIKGILNENKIPYFIKDHGAGDLLRIKTGSSLWMQTDIYVSKHDYEKSQKLIDDILGKNTKD